MLELADWLRQHIPSEDSSGATAGLVHGDFRIDNIVFHPTEVGIYLNFLYFLDMHWFL